MDALKLIIAIAVKFNWVCKQLDIKAAYLNARLDEEIYVMIPQGDRYFERGYWRLNKALYGLKQSGRQWNRTISNFLTKNGYKQLKSEQCIFIKENKNKLTCIIGIYVDDMIITGIENETNKIIKRIKENFKISNSGDLNYILGIEIENKNNIYYISQKNYINNILERFNINNIKKSKTPCTGDNIKTENKKEFNKTIYKSAIGALIFLSKCTRPDITFAVHKAARNCEEPTISDWKKVMNILKYLNGTKEYKLKYDGKGEIIAYSDADFAGDIKDRKSTSGYIILMGNSPISWSSKKQTIVATSTAEAEYISTSECIKKILWYKNILNEIFKFSKPIKLYTDNLSSKTSMENGDLNTKLKHIEIKYYFNKDLIEKNIIKLEYINTSEMLADILTKNVNGTKMTKFANKIFFKII